MFENLWGRITGADKKRNSPDQQCALLGRIGDYTVIYPYGLYCDLPDDVFLRKIGRGAVLPVTVDRPSDNARGEPVLFHPVNKTRIILRNNGDIDIISAGDINMSGNDMNIDLSGDMTINANKVDINTIAVPGMENNGTDISDRHIHSQGSDSNGDSEADTGFPHS